MASTSGSNMSSLQTPIFIGKNYEYWSLTMKVLFIGKYVWEIVQNGYVEPTDQVAYNNLTQAKKYVLSSNRGRKMERLYSTYTKPCMKAYSQE